MVHILSIPFVLASILASPSVLQLDRRFSGRGGLIVAALKHTNQDLSKLDQPDLEVGDLLHGNYPSVTRAQEMKFIDKLSHLASKYDLHAWYDVSQPRDFALPHLSSLFHLHAPHRADGMPMTLTYPSNARYLAPTKNDTDQFYRQHGMEKFVPSSWKSVDDVVQFMSSPGHFVVTIDNAKNYGWTGGRNDRAEPFTDAQAVYLEHGVDEDRRYYIAAPIQKPAPQHVRPPVSFSKYYKSNIEVGGMTQLSKEDLTALAGFKDPHKPLLVYFVSYDCEEGHSSAIFSVPKDEDLNDENVYKPLFDVKELETLQREYNVILRPHPHLPQRSSEYALNVKMDLLKLNGVKFDGWPQKPLREDMPYTALYGHADVLIVEVSAVASASMALAIDKPIIMVRRLANDERLADLAEINAAITDDLVHAWRPEKGEKLVDAVKAGVADFEAAADEMAAKRRSFAMRFFGCELDGYEEYRLMFGILNNLPIQRTGWYEDLSELRDLYPGKSVLPPTQLSITKFDDEVLLLYPERYKYYKFVKVALVVGGILLLVAFVWLCRGETTWRTNACEEVAIAEKAENADKC